MSKILTDSIIPALKAETAIEDSGWLDLEFDTSNFEVGLNFPPQYRKIILPNGGGYYSFGGLLLPQSYSTIRTS